MKEEINFDKYTIAPFISQIHGLDWLIPDKIFVTIGDESYLKILDFEENKICNGGSLSKRLSDKILTCMKVDRKTRRVYLGTNGDELFVYEILEKNFNLKHLFTISLKFDKPFITSLEIHGE